MNTIYTDNLVRSYGNTETAADKSQRFKSDFKFEELRTGMKVLNVKINTTSEILELRSGFSNDILTQDATNKKNVDESGKRKGINCKNWYSMEDFNRTFRRIKN